MRGIVIGGDDGTEAGSAKSLKRLDTEDAKKTYRYLRIGTIGAVVALGLSILIAARTAE